MSEPPIAAAITEKWPPVAERIELTRDMELGEAAYWLAAESRRRQCAVVARFREGQLYAWPHLRVDEIAHTFIRIEEVRNELSPTGRWSSSRKQLLVELIEHGLVDRRSALAEFEISEDEYVEWLIRYAPPPKARKVA